MSMQVRLQLNRDAFHLEVDMEIPSLGVTGVFGPSGSGKTSLLRAIAGLDRPSSAHIEIGGEVWQKGSDFVPPHQRELGFVFHEPSLFAHLNVERNIAFARKQDVNSKCKISVQDCVKLLGIGALLKRLPHQLSGGEQQRVAIARALASSPKVLLMDEPMASLDDARKQELLPYFESLHRELEIPILSVSHAREEILRLADHMVLLENGKVKAMGPAVEIASRMDLSLAQMPDAQCILETVVMEHDVEFGLAYLEFSGGRIAVPRQNLAIGSAVRLLVRASDVSITLDRANQSSILNILEAKVESLADFRDAQRTVRLSLGHDSLLARITRKSASQLNLHPGMRVFVQVKSVAVLN